MNRKLTLIAVAMAAGVGYDRAAELVTELYRTLPSDDIAAGRAVANAANALTYPA